DTRATNLLPNQPNGIPAAGGRQGLTTQLAFGPGGANSPASPLPGATVAGGKSQHDVLQDFFQSLLRGGAGAASSSGTSAAAAPSSASTATAAVAASAPQIQIQQPAATSTEPKTNGEDTEEES
ncbi:hypothetical protein FRC00_013779, partial [Tulasnella sp. 408]